MAFKELSERRQDFRGLASGVDRASSLAILDRLDPPAKGMMRCILAGDLALENQAKHWNGGDGTCLWCHEAIETAVHRLWACPRWWKSTD